MENKKKLLGSLPKVDEVLMDKRIDEFTSKLPREIIVDSIRETISDHRQMILESEDLVNFDESIFFIKLKEKIKSRYKHNLFHVINATGVVLHTNLGRAVLSQKSVESIIEVAKGYSTLEYNVKKGKRGSRHDHVENLICKLIGAEAAMVVNNNAAATMLCLSAMAENKEVIVSRGELVEIGGSFRVPDIMERSGAKLVEVGTTNKTKDRDYEKAITEETGAIMKVHTSNYKILGFTSEASLDELVKIGKVHNLPVIYDMGSGLMLNLEKCGIKEPTVIDSLKTGIDVILFSGDKLLGGPQAGILAGKKEYIEKMKNHPLARAFRIDKFTLAALESTFREYHDEPLEKIPTLKMLTETRENLKEKAKELKELIGPTPIFVLEVVDSKEQVGGGSAPTAVLYGASLKLTADIKAEKIERLLRKADTPIIARVYNDSIYFDMRTIMTEELETIATAVKNIEKIFLERED